MGNYDNPKISIFKSLPIRERAVKIFSTLGEMYPEADCTLDFKEPYRLLISGILAAQCTDARVNIITGELFRKYPRIEDIANAEISDIKEIIRSCGFYNSKSGYIVESARKIIEDFNGIVPREREELTSLPGVGRKIANLIMGDCFKIPAIVVDTHCLRISFRLGLSNYKDPLRTEKSLMRHLPENCWISFGHRIVAHGREICRAVSPKCDTCRLLTLCKKGIEDFGK